MQTRPPLPPFTEETARIKVKAAEDAWNTRDPERVAGAYTEDSVWLARPSHYPHIEAVPPNPRRLHGRSPG